jgi:hypothetical protein
LAIAIRAALPYLAWPPFALFLKRETLARRLSYVSFAVQ